MKIGVMSDTHLGQVNERLRDLVENRFKDAEMILHAGDIASGEVLNYLENFNTIAVQGNMDPTPVSQSLPVKRVIKAAGFKIGLIHGFGAPRGLAHMLRTEFDEIDCLVFGHSHEPMNQRHGNELWFNPGAVSGGRNGATAGFLHLTDRINGEIIFL